MRIEQELFDWEGWDPVDELVIQVYKVKLKQDLGPLKAGQTFVCATLDFQRSVLEFWDSSNQSYKFTLQLNVTFVPKEDVNAQQE